MKLPTPRQLNNFYSRNKLMFVDFRYKVNYLLSRIFIIYKLLTTNKTLKQLRKYFNCREMVQLLDRHQDLSQDAPIRKINLIGSIHNSVLTALGLEEIKQGPFYLYLKWQIYHHLALFQLALNSHTNCIFHRIQEKILEVVLLVPLKIQGSKDRTLL